jgi:hypothetical protein
MGFKRIFRGWWWLFPGYWTKKHTHNALKQRRRVRRQKLDKNALSRRKLTQWREQTHDKLTPWQEQREADLNTKEHSLNALAREQAQCKTQLDAQAWQLAQQQERLYRLEDCFARKLAQRQNKLDPQESQLAQREKQLDVFEDCLAREQARCQHNMPERSPTPPMRMPFNPFS